MEAKDTVMSKEEQQRFKQIADSYANDLQQSTEGHFKQEDIEAIYDDAERERLNKQAEISFKAGEQQGIEKGRKEVVDAIKVEIRHSSYMGYLRIDEDWWQAFLNWRGIDKEE